MGPEQYRQEIAALRQDQEALEFLMSEQNAGKDMELRQLTIGDVQEALPQGAALLEIARYRPKSRRGATRHSDRYAAYVLKATGAPCAVDLGEARIVDELVQDARRAFADPDLTRNPKSTARALDRVLMEPVRKLLGGTRWVFLSADGPLHLVPFDALVDENGRYLVEQYLFSYVTTGRELLRFREKRASAEEPPLIVANPAFEMNKVSAASEATYRGMRSIDMISQPLLPLGSTVREARTIQALFPDSRVAIGADATEEIVKSSHSPRVLHLATHGFFLPARPGADILPDTPESYASLDARDARIYRENPLLRSGLALAGFNQRRSDVDDGVLTALEVTGLNLQGTRLVVLSACETGVGEASPGEGVFGLRRAFVIAGSETQVMSLWQVDTGRTRELMEAYYRQLKQGVGRSEAMRNVQLAMLVDSATSHPNLWASFIVSGDWRPLDGKEHLPDIRVHPNLRGCTCQYAGELYVVDNTLASVIMLLLTIARRRHIRQVCH